MKECPFKVGDVVRHKASKEEAVVEAINYRCPKHSKPFSGLPALACDSNCVKEFTGWVTLDIGFNKDVCQVNVRSLERKAE